MKKFSFISLIVMLVSAVFTWNAIALPISKVHLLDNLSPEEAHLVHKIIEKKGYKLSRQPLFNESKEAVVITKAIGNELEPPSIQVEVVHMERDQKIPKRVYHLKLETKNIVEAMDKFPTPDQLKQTINSVNETIPVAYQE